MEKYFILFLILLSANSANSAPSIISATVASSVLTVAGSEFGERQDAPVYFANFDNETTGTLPTGQVTNQVKYGTVRANRTHSGSKSLEFNYDAVSGLETGEWERNAIDMGEAGVGSIYYSTWLYLDKTGTTDTSWQWKNFTATACADMYGCNVALNPFILFEPWVNGSFNWFNTGNPHVYKGAQVLAETFTAPPDLYLWGEWQRVEVYLQKSSPDATANGTVYLNRVGRGTVIIDDATVVTHASGDNNWRYFVLSHAIESATDGEVHLDVFMDDVYVDTSRARVEICDTDTWVARTHCEIQPSTAWAAGEITAAVNQGSFAGGATAYLYVIDADGVVNADGYQITLGETAPTNAVPRGTVPLGDMR